jgi:hypothetical protein
MTWNAFTATLSENDHKRLVIALGAGLQEARQASAVATGNGLLEDARRHVATALAHLEDVRVLLGSPAAP